MTRDITDRLLNFTTQDYLNANGFEFGDRSSVPVSDILGAMAERCSLEYRDDDGGEGPIEVRRIALNMDQVEQYGPPPNPAKLTDSRVDDYLARFGDESWELDALDPAVLDDLIETHVLAERDQQAWDLVAGEEEDGRRLLLQTSRRWPEVVEFLDA